MTENPFLNYNKYQLISGKSNDDLKNNRANSNGYALTTETITNKNKYEINLLLR